MRVKISGIYSVIANEGGGEREIRTLDRVNPVPPFQGGDLNRSSISPAGSSSFKLVRRIIYDTCMMTK